ncbi:MAG: ferrochelatase [Pirellulales bacterium]
MPDTAEQPYDALLLVSFGGPEGPDDILPFLDNVLRARRVPPQRMLEVAEHYRRFGGVSPINEQNRWLIRALEAEFQRHGPRLPVYFGNRNWHPLIAEALTQMAADGVRRALAFCTSAYSSYSGCRQYRENIEDARTRIGPSTPRVDKLRVFYNHPGFVETMTDRVRDALAAIPGHRHAAAHLVFTAHSIPQAMAANCRYQSQLAESCRLVADALAESGPRLPWKLVYQSRSGPPEQPWLEPDVRDYLGELAGRGVDDVVVVPIGFLSDHIEVLYDLDVEAAGLCRSLGLNMLRAGTAGTHPAFVQMIRELVLERMGHADRRALGTCGPSHDVCPADCCPSGATRPGETAS